MKVIIVLVLIYPHQLFECCENVLVIMELTSPDQTFRCREGASELTHVIGWIASDLWLEPLLNFRRNIQIIGAKKIVEYVILQADSAATI